MMVLAIAGVIKPDLELPLPHIFQVYRTYQVVNVTVVMP